MDWRICNGDIYRSVIPCHEPMGCSARSRIRMEPNSTGLGFDLYPGGRRPYGAAGRLFDG